MTNTRRNCSSDIAELDFLIDEILLASRLDANVALQATEDVDLLGSRSRGMRALRKLHVGRR